MKNLIHIYTGDGKGKTTAAVGLSIRFAGNDGNVLFTQFLKDEESSELGVLQKIEGIEVDICSEFFGFYWKMNDETKKRAREVYSQHLRRIVQRVLREEYQMLVLDEIVVAYHYDFIDREFLLDFLRQKPDHLEVVMTGRYPEPELMEVADYISEIIKVKHPYDQGIESREGIER